MFATLEPTRPAPLLLPAVPRSGIVAFEREYYYGGDIASARPGKTYYEQPKDIVTIGRTRVREAEFHEWLRVAGRTTFKPHDYNMMRHNCNHFTDAAARFLCGVGIPVEVV